VIKTAVGNYEYDIRVVILRLIELRIAWLRVLETLDE
jgi:hypothetical protein